MTAIDDFFNDQIRIPSPPAVAVRILEAVKKDESSFRDLSKIISADTALSAKILKIANSSYYGIPRKIDSIERALGIIGTKAVKNIALSFVIAKEFRESSEGQFDFSYFWIRALTSAVSADLLTSFIGNKNEDIFVTALLQDIGILLMYLCEPNDYMKAIDEKRSSTQAIQVVEKNIFGFDHQELGSAVLKKWGIPNTIYNPVRYHHVASDAPKELKDITSILFLSDKMSSIYHGARSAEKYQEIKRILTHDYAVDEKDLESLIDSIADKSFEILSFFEIDHANMKPYSQILQEANEELGKLNLSYEQLVMELKRANERTEQFALELKDANEKLREMAFRDGLTGLYNHRYFQELLDREISRARRYARSFSLIMLDLDHFKKINDKFGHPVGDIVLENISLLISDTIRSSDFAARYGGEEFAIVVPETDLKGVAVLAERLRKAVEQLEIRIGDCNISTTISIGGTCYNPSDGQIEKSDIILAADNALYDSKKAGRNKICLASLTDGTRMQPSRNKLLEVF